MPLAPTGWFTPTTEVIHPAVTRLAADTAMVRHAYARRLPLAAEALLGGAMPQQVAEAVGLEVHELREAVARWAVRQVRQGQLTEEQYTRLINTVFGPAGW